MPYNRMYYLFHRYFDKTATEEEQAELMALLQLSENDEHLNTLLEHAWQQLDHEKGIFTPQQSENMLRKVLQSRADNDHATQTPVLSVGGARIRTIRKLGAAAAILLTGFTGTYLLFQKHKNQSNIAQTTAHKPAVIDVPAPNGNNAILTLADGSTVVLDSAHNGSIAQQGDASISKVNAGKLVYNPLGENQTKVVYNTISTRRGGQFQIVLPDGSKVWLNTLSSLRFPTAFQGTERTVELTGEAYFEVAKNSNMPFKVHVIPDCAGKKCCCGMDSMNVQVLGTSFNVMAYSNESEIKTTLLDGAVKVLKGKEGTLLSPGEQMKLNMEGKGSVDKHADTELAVAWKNGSTSFKSADIQSIMRQAARWYDIDVAFEGHIPERQFTGAIPRNANLSELIRLLEVSKINFKLEGKKLTVMP